MRTKLSGWIKHMRSRYSCRDNFDHMRPSEQNIRNKINIIICPNKTYLIESIKKNKQNKYNVIIRDEIKEHWTWTPFLRNAEKFNLNDCVCILEVL